MINIEPNNLVGYLSIIVGPMYSGKTSRLLEYYKQYKFCNISVAVINYVDDTRYSSTMLSTHDKNMIPCTMTNLLFDAFPLNVDALSKYKVFLINEGQFFDDIVEWVAIIISHCVEIVMKKKFDEYIFFYIKILIFKPYKKEDILNIKRIA